MVVHSFLTGTRWHTSQLELNYFIGSNINLGLILISTSTKSFKSSIDVKKKYCQIKYKIGDSLQRQCLDKTGDRMSTRLDCIVLLTNIIMVASNSIRWYNLYCSVPSLMINYRLNDHQGWHLQNIMKLRFFQNHF